MFRLSIRELVAVFLIAVAIWLGDRWLGGKLTKRLGNSELGNKSKDPTAADDEHRKQWVRFGVWLSTIGLLAAIVVLVLLFVFSPSLRRTSELLEWHLIADSVLCGAVRLNHIDSQNRNASVGYFLSADYQHRGIAFRSVQSVLDFGFTELKLHRVELKCAFDNEASVRLAERLGFVLEGRVREAELLGGRFTDQFVYGLLRTEFRAISSAEQPSEQC